MKRALLLLPFLLACAQALTLGGSVRGDLPARARVSAWLVDEGGRPLSELASAAVNGKFRLDVPDEAPSGRAAWTLTPENIAWPGVTGEVRVSNTARSGELRLFVYGDENGNGRRDENEALLEGGAARGRANVLFVYAGEDTTVSAARGVEVKLTPGWNVLEIELGKNIRVTVERSAADLTLNVAP